MDQIYQHINQYINERNPVYTDLIRLRSLELEVAKMRLQVESHKLQSNTLAGSSRGPEQTSISKVITSDEKTREAVKWVKCNEPVTGEKLIDYYERYTQYLNKDYRVSEVELEYIVFYSHDRYVSYLEQGGVWYRVW